MSSGSYQYSVDLSGIPPNARVIVAKANYQLYGSGGGMSDDGGSATIPPNSPVIFWNATGLALLNAAIGAGASTYSVSVVFNATPPSSGPQGCLPLQFQMKWQLES